MFSPSEYRELLMILLFLGFFMGFYLFVGALVTACNFWREKRHKLQSIK